MTTLSVETPAGFVPVALAGLVGEEPLPFPVYLRTGNGPPVLYRDEHSAFGHVHLARLQTEGVRSVYIRDQDRAPYHRRVERELDRLLRNNEVPIENRAAVLCGVAAEVAQDLLAAPPRREQVARAQRMLGAASALLLRDRKAFAAVRSVLRATPELAHHSMVVSLLSLGLARQVIGGDATALVHAGLAGLLHDAGRIGHEGEVEDAEHVRRGVALLEPTGVPREVCEAVASHHERLDGSGYPGRARGSAVPLLARIVGLVDTFSVIHADIHAEQGPRARVYDALRTLAEAHRGCFDEQMAVALVQMFKLA